MNHGSRDGGPKAQALWRKGSLGRWLLSWPQRGEADEEGEKDIPGRENALRDENHQEVV